MTLDGIIVLSAQLGRHKTRHRFYASPELERELVLDGECLVRNNAVLLFDPPTLTLGEENISMG